MFDENNIEDCRREIERLKKERKSDYNQLLKQYLIVQKFLEKNPRNLKRDKRQKKKIKELDIEYKFGFAEGLMRGMILLDDNLTTPIDNWNIGE